jgi:hypothetical protein
MDAEWKRKWVEALRSGKYKQGKHQLTDGDTFCCLGVLTDLYIKENGYAWGSDYVGSWPKDGCLSYKVSCGVGLDEYDPGVKGRGLSSWNDDIGYDFNQIADLIEKHL